MRSPRVTIRLHAWALADLEQVAVLLGTSVGQVVSALLELAAASSGPRQTNAPSVCPRPAAHVRVRLSPGAWDAALVMMGDWKRPYGLRVGHILSTFLGAVDAETGRGAADLAIALDRSLPGGLLAFYRRVCGLT